MRTRTSMAKRLSSSGELFLQPAGDALRDEAVDVTAECGELLDSAGAQETVLRAGHQVERVDVRGLHPVELPHLQLVLEVGDRAQALDDRPGADGPREVDDQDAERLGPDVAERLGRLADERQALLDVEDRLVLANGDVDDGHDDLVELRGGARDDVQVAVGDRVVAAGADSDALLVGHAVWMRRRVSPYRRSNV